MNGSAAKQIASKVDTRAKTQNVSGTPTVLVGPKGGKLHASVPPRYSPNLQETEQALDNALANS